MDVFEKNDESFHYQGGKLYMTSPGLPGRKKIIPKKIISGFRHSGGGWKKKGTLVPVKQVK
jgi:hypothetical protein